MRPDYNQADKICHPDKISIKAILCRKLRCDTEVYFPIPISTLTILTRIPNHKLNQTHLRLLSLITKIIDTYSPTHTFPQRSNPHSQTHPIPRHQTQIHYRNKSQPPFYSLRYRRKAAEIGYGPATKSVETRGT